MKIRIVLALSVMFAASQARAQTCNFSISDVNFGTVDVIAGGVVDVTATIDVSCSGLILETIRVCPNIRAGSGGADATARYMDGPSTPKLAYQLYQDAARTVIWGSADNALPGDPPDINLFLGLSGSASTSVTIYARVFAGQTSVPAGSYLSNFTTLETRFDYGINILGLISCDGLPLLQNTANPTFAVIAEVQKNCLVNALDIDFGTHGVLTTNIDATGQISATCTVDTPYTIELDGGLAGAPPAARLMSNGPETVTYGLYQDAARTQPWGDSGTPGSTVSATGTGSTQNFTVYGRIPPQTTPPPGTYTDTVVVTISY